MWRVFNRPGWVREMIGACGSTCERRRAVLMYVMMFVQVAVGKKVRAPCTSCNQAHGTKKAEFLGYPKQLICGELCNRRDFHMIFCFLRMGGVAAVQSDHQKLRR